jgi:hypothetical protein
MMILWAAGLLMLTVAAPVSAADESAYEIVEAGFRPLFNGKTLEGWERFGGTATYAVEDGCIVGRTSAGSPNSFLCSQKDYGDFELRFEVRVSDELNSGVQIRSQVCSDKQKRRVHGPQVEIATNGTAGGVWGESLGTGWLNPDADRQNPTKTGAFKNGQWNSYRVRAVGPHLQTWINDVPITDATDDKTGMTSGFLGLQVHGVKKGSGPYEVRWRNIRIQELTGTDAAK